MTILSFENKHVHYHGIEDYNDSTSPLYETYEGLLIYDTVLNKFNDIVYIADGNQVSFAPSERTYTNDVVIYGIPTGGYARIEYNMEQETQLSLNSDIMVSSQPRPLSTMINKVGFLKYSNNTWHPSIPWYLDKQIHTLKINNKEVLQIKRNSDNKILYQH